MSVDLHLMVRPPHLIVTQVASPVELLVGSYCLPDSTLSGVVCGDCTDELGRVTRHASVAHVRFCWSQKVYWEAEAKAEAEMEQRSATWWDNGGPDSDLITWEHEQDLLREQQWAW